MSATTPGSASLLLHEDPSVHARRWSILAVMCLGLVLVVMAVSGINVALPTIQQDLATTGSEMLWIVDAYAIVFAGVLFTAGALGDKFGRKGALQAGLVVFAIGAIVATLASSAPQIIAGRAVMGVGAAFIMPSTLSIITAVFPPEERRKAIAIWAGFAGAGGAIGPIVSGLLVTGWWVIPQFWWGAAFLVNVPVIIGVLGAVSYMTPKSREAVVTPLDPIGAGASITAIGALLYAIIEGGHRGWADPVVLIAFVAAAMTGAVFLWWERRTEHPMLPLSLFRTRTFSVGAGVITAVFSIMFAFFFLNTLYLQFVLGYSALTAGVATLPLAIASVVIAPRSAALAARFGAGPTMGAGFLAVTVGLGVLATVSTTTTYPWLAVGFVLLGTGLSLASAPATGNIMVSTPLDKAGVGSAMNDTTRELGGALGIAAGGSLVATIYTATIDVTSFGLGPGATAAAEESIGAALAIAETAGQETGPQIVFAAQNAFTTAFAWTMAIGAAVALIAAVVTWRSMPSRDYPANEHTDNENDSRWDRTSTDNAQTRSLGRIEV